MKLKFLPWVLVVVSVAGAGILYNSNQQQAGELAQARQASQELEQLRATMSDQHAEAGAKDELARLREENKDVLRLRNEVRRLREENQQFSKQAQAAQAQVQSVQAQAEALRASAAQATAQAQQAEGAARMQTLANACINNLRQIDGATQQWALENRKDATARVTMADILPYLRNKPPICPANGTYTLSTVSSLPTCSVPGHMLPKSP